MIKERIIILSGASLVVQGVIETTPDIDLSCDREYYDNLEGQIRKGAFGIEVKIIGVFDVSYNHIILMKLY